MKNDLRVQMRVLKICFFLALFSSYVIAQTDISSQYTFKPVKTGGGGYVTGLTINPNFDNVVYCRTDVGGAYKYNFSTNKWEQLVTSARMPSAWMNVADDAGSGAGTKRRRAYPVAAIATDPNNASIFYMVSDGGLFKSTNGGGAFSWLQGFTVKASGNDHSGERTSGERLQINPFNSNQLLYGSQYNGLFRSNDGGVSWSALSSLPVNTTGGIVWIQYDKNTSGRVYASVKGYGVYRSNDGGTTWSSIKSSTNLSKDGEVVNGLLWFVVANDGVYKYNGTTATKVSSQNAEDLAVDPNNNQVVYVISSGFNNNTSLKRTTNGGTSWTDMTRNVYSSIGWKAGADFCQPGGWLSIGDITIDPRNSGRMWFAEGMGMWRANISNTLNNPQFVDISDGIEELVATDIVSSHNGRFTVSCWDRVGLEFSNPDQFSPQQASANSSLFSGGSSVASSPTNPNFVIITSSDFVRAGSGNVLNFSASSTDGGSNWTKFGSVNSSWQNNPADLVAGEAVVAANNNSNLVWVPRNGTNNNIYYSTNTGSSWTKANISGYSNSNGSYLTAKKVLCADATTSGKFYVYNWSTGKVMVSTDGGANWSAKAGSLPTYCWHPHIKYAPGKAGHIWFASGWDYAAQPGLWYSTNSGDAFTKVSAVQECWSVGFGKEASGASYPTIYIFGKINNAWGMYRSTDQAASWSKIVDYPLGIFDQVTAIEGDVDVFGKVYVGFSGNGWAYGTTGATPVTYTLTTSSPNGSITRDPNSSSYTSGATVTLTANPSSGYTFTGWSGDASGTTNPLTITMNSNKNITANFTATSTNYTLTTTSSNGSISRNPNASSYASGTIVTLTANPNSGYTFTGWSGDASGTTNPLSITMNANKNVTANFTSSTGDCTLYQAETGYTGSSVVVATNNAGYTGSGFLDYGGQNSYAEWTVSVATAGSYTFKFRHGNGSTGNRQCEFKANGSAKGNVAFAPTGGWSTWGIVEFTVALNAGNNTIRLTANTSAGGPNLDNYEVCGGTTAPVMYTLTTSSPNGSISRNPNATSYANGTIVTLTANPSAGYSFSNWTGDVTGTTNPVNITMNANKSVTANFSLVPVTDCILANPSFESDLQNWTINSGTVAISTSATDGAKSARLYGTNAGMEQAYIKNVATGTTVTLSFDAKIAGTVGWAGVGLDFKDASNVDLLKLNVQITNTSYQAKTIVGNAPAGTAKLNVWAYTSSGELYVDDFCISGTGLKSAEISPAGNPTRLLNVYPNPVSGEENLHIEMSDINGNTELTLVDIAGKVHQSEVILGCEGSLNHTLNITNRQKGVYLLFIQTSQKRFVERVVIK